MICNKLNAQRWALTVTGLSTQQPLSLKQRLNNAYTLSTRNNTSVYQRTNLPAEKEPPWINLLPHE